MARLYAPFLCALLLASCAAPQPVAEREARVRCANIALVLEFMVRSDPDASALRAQIEEARASLAKTENELADAKEGDRAGVSLERDEKRGRLGKLAADEDSRKKQLMIELQRALAAVASRQQVDYIIAAGDAVVYYRKEFDLTEDVIREIVSQRKRNAPITR